MHSSEQIKKTIAEDSVGEAPSVKVWVLYGALLLALTQGFLWLTARFWHFLTN